MEVESLAVNSSPSVGVATMHINGPRTLPAAPHRTPPVVQVAVVAQRSPSRPGTDDAGTQQPTWQPKGTRQLHVAPVHVLDNAVWQVGP
jgi:hypothetical protein